MQALAQGSSVLVAAPTGTGKTVVAEFGVFLARRAGLKAIYTTPIKALSNQKFRDFRRQLGDAVGLLTGDVAVNPSASVLVMTTEVLRNMLVQGGSLDDVGVVVFDEVHYMGDPERGTAWEEAILLAPRHLPLVCLSATVPNAPELAAWLEEVHGKLHAVLHEQRAVPLELRYFLEGKAHLALDEDGQRRAQLLGVGGELAERVGWSGSLPRSNLSGSSDPQRPERRPRREAEPWEVVRYLDAQRLTPAIYFLFGRRACELAAASCLALPVLPWGQELVAEARSRLRDLGPEDRRLGQVSLLLRLLPHGIAVHHAGLLPIIKMLVEELFASGRLRAVFATETLALGINMPARTVVIGEMVKWDGQVRRLVSPNEFRQMTGRAGRRGIDLRGLALLLYSPWVPFARAFEVATGELLPLESAFRPTYNTALNLWRRPGDDQRLAQLYALSLRRLQHDARLEELTFKHTELQHRIDALRPSREAALLQELTSVERARADAQQAAERDTRRTAEGLASILERFGYLSNKRPTSKAATLRHLFDTNALTLAELLEARQLEALLPDEIAEACSWFAFDSDRPVRPMPLHGRLFRLRDEVGRLHGRILDDERRLHLEVSRPLNADFRGVVLAWAEGVDLARVSQRSRLAEGDLVNLLQKTLDLLSQLTDAARQLPAQNASILLPKLEAADGALRRGVVETTYRWAISGPPQPGEVDDETWPAETAGPPEAVLDRRPMRARPHGRWGRFARPRRRR